MERPITCEVCREALSARIDGEHVDVPGSSVDAHLAACPDCGGWQAAALDVSRWLRVRPAVASPDLTGPIVARYRQRSRGWLASRIGLGAVAAVLVVTGVSQFLGGGHAHDGVLDWTGHLQDESAAWNLAIGFGLGWATLRPAHARGLLPTLVAFTALLTAVSVRDLVSAAVPLGRVLSHLPILGGVLLLHVVERLHGGPWNGSPLRLADTGRGSRRRSRAAA